MNNAIPYQKCPKCDGQGTTCKPPYISGDQYTWSSSALNFVCNVCEGRKIIPMFAPQSEIDEFIAFIKKNYHEAVFSEMWFENGSNAEHSLDEVLEKFKERDV